MAHREIPLRMPDVLMVGQRAEPLLWTYTQAPGLIQDDDGSLVLLHNGGAPSIPESNWMLRIPAAGERYKRPTHHVLFSGDDHENETGLFGVCRTPDHWPADKRWLLAWSGAWQADWGAQKPYRVWCGLATAPSLSGPWTRKQAAIPSTRNVPQAAPPNAWWPNGTWAVAPLCLGDRVLVVVRDNSHATLPGARHLVYEVYPNLAVSLNASGLPMPIGRITVAGEVPQAWLTDVAPDSAGRWFALDGGDPAQIPTRDRITEVASPGPWDGRGAVVLEATGEVYQHPTPTVRTLDGGYLRTPEGRRIEPVVVVGCVVTSPDWTRRGDWKLQAWGDNETLDRLCAEAQLHYLGDPPGLVVEFGGDLDLCLDLVALGPTTVEWEGHIHQLTPRPMAHAADVQSVRPAALWPGYMDPEYRAQQARGERVVLVTVRGEWWGGARIDAPGGGLVYPRGVNGRWL